MSGTLSNLKFKKEDIWTIPNIMSYFRIALIPIFCWLYLTAQTEIDYYKAGGVVIISTLTDFFDGLIARKFQMITELGKCIDPLADKLTHGALVGCLASKYTLLWAVFATMVIKEIYMLIRGWFMLKQNKKLPGALWFGKVSTAVLFGVICLLLFWLEMPMTLANGLIILCIALLVFAWIMYEGAYRKL
ncbi:MAG: CDP-alcohol phosphatidyltransferase family protein [Lachnospiraceae bacterium]|nr:CDP-alcohol phosphatidyltransferase family protein [Lachnospiraceae bacterium]